MTVDEPSAEEFEANARLVCQQIYGIGDLSPIKIDGRERDGVINTGSEIIILEATKLRTVLKIENDLKKSVSLVRYLRSRNDFKNFNFRILLVTFHEPTADQIGAMSGNFGCPVELISLRSLFSRLFDARKYFRLRENHAFGSIQDPAEGGKPVPPSSYVPLAINNSSNGETLNAQKLAQFIDSEHKVILVGDYGSGKSMTLRDVYFRAKERYLTGLSRKCPIYINLREHIAQDEPEEVFFRHARKLGFADHSSFVAAWRANYLTIMLDGFDELTPSQFAVSISDLSEARSVAVQIVREFINQSDASCGIIVAGREHYFDSRQEMRDAITPREDNPIMELSGFSDEQIAKYLKVSKARLPSWLPTRPLLLGYLANLGVLKGDGQDGFELDPADGWNTIISKVCEREVAQIWGKGFKGPQLRLYIESLASKARHSSTNKIIQQSDLQDVFRVVFGKDADQPVELLTKRLPGLGAVPATEGARQFVDEDFADAAAGGDMAKLIENCHEVPHFLMGVRGSLGTLGRDIAVRIAHVHPKIYSVALRGIYEIDDLSVACADLITCMTENGISYTGGKIIISGLEFDRISFDGDVDFSEVAFSECLFGRVEFGRRSSDSEDMTFPTFRGCLVSTLEGAASASDLPAKVLSPNTQVDVFQGYGETNDAIMESSLDPRVKVLLTILRKVFFQRGGGRQVRALLRGMPHQHTPFVEPIVTILSRFGLVEEMSISGRKMVMPIRSQSSHALSIVSAPNSKNDVIVAAVKAL